MILSVKKTIDFETRKHEQTNKKGRISSKRPVKVLCSIVYKSNAVFKFEKKEIKIIEIQTIEMISQLQYFRQIFFLENG